LRWETRLLVMVTAILTVFGLASLYAAAPMEADSVGLFSDQLIGAVVGALMLSVMSRVDYHLWQKLAWPMLLLSIGFLLLLVFHVPGIAPRINAAYRWVRIGPVQFQASELARFTVVVWAAMLAAKKGEAVRGFKTGVTPFLMVIGFVALLILLQPNLSMASLVALSGGVVLFTAGARIGHFLLLGVAALFGGVSLIWAESYRLERLKCFLEPVCGEGGRQLNQALIGFGSGGPFGAGFGQGQIKMRYVPYAYSDFLFSTIGEEWGFLGVTVVVALFAIFFSLGFRIAKTAPDPFGQYLAAGLTATVALAASLHAAVNLGLMPTTGLGLPFMSHGRSGLLIALLSVAVLVNIGRARGKPVKPQVSGKR
jgi:cell division protein FtsW